MARYVDTALSPGEKILYDAKVHWAIFITPVFRLIWLSVIFAAISLFFSGHIGLSFFNVHSLPEKLTGSSSPFRTIFEFGLIPLIIAVVLLQGFVHAVIYYFNSDFVLTDRRVISKFGLLSRTTSEQRLSKVESIHVYQSLLGRILGFGNITVTGTGSSTTTFGPMADPLACKRAIEGQLDLQKHAGPNAD